MKKVWFIVIFLLIILLSYTAQFRYSTSEVYKKNINKERLFTWGTLTIRDSKDFTETIYYPIDNKWFKLCINWANILATFFVYNILWYKEYKPSGSSQIINMWNITCLELSPSQKIFSDTEIGIKNIVRNTFLDKWGILVWIAVQLAPLSWEDIVIKSFSKYNADRAIWEFQKRFDALEDMPIVTNQKAQRTIIFWETVTWRISTHDYPDLGIKIYSDDPYSKSFQIEAPFIVKNRNTLIDPFNPGQYIAILAKYPDQSIQQIFDREYAYQFASGCKLEKNSNNSFTWNNEEYIVINDEWWSCFAGWNGMHQQHIRFLYNKNNPDRYYLVNLDDACAPGKCNVFNKIELY